MKFDTVAEKCMMIVTPTIFSEYESGTYSWNGLSLGFCLAGDQLTASSPPSILVHVPKPPDSLAGS